jgi:hypothetical protein
MRHSGETWGRRAARLALTWSAAAAIGLAAAAQPRRSSDDLQFLNQIAAKVLASSLVAPGARIPSGPTNTTSYTLRVPGGTQNYYPAFWIRDAALMLGGDFIPAPEVEGWIRLIAATQPGPKGLSFGKLVVPPFSIPDHITLSGEACWYPGAYTEQGNGTFGFLPPADDAFYFIQMVHANWRLTESLALFQSAVRTSWGTPRLSEICRKAFDSVATEPTSGLVRCEPAANRTRVDWGFCDAIRKTGLCLMPSLLRWAAARDLAELFQRQGNQAEAESLHEQMKKISAAIPSVFGRELAGQNKEMLLLSATELGRKDDIWASAYAVWLGLLPRDLDLAVARHLVALYNAGGSVIEGQVRHLPPVGDFGGYWEQASCKRDTYQNGGYWATPTGWLIVALAKANPAAADRLFQEYAAYLRKHQGEGAPWEWINPGQNLQVNARYGSSIGCVDLAIQRKAPSARERLVSGRHPN